VVVDFGTLALPEDVRRALADAFRNHYGARPPHSAQDSWHRLKIFGRFVAESHAVRCLDDLVRTQCLDTGAVQRAITARIYFNHLRTLVRWMNREGFARFDELDATAL
jgi:hypothetical protein